MKYEVQSPSPAFPVHHSSLLIHHSSSCILYFIAPTAAPSMKRPVGVTILAIINGLGALVLGLIGISAFLAGPILDQLMQDPDLAELLATVPPEAIDIFPKVLGAIFLVLALTNVAIAVGLWTLQTWAWYLTLVFQGLGVVSNLGGLLLLNPVSLASIVFSGFYIYYFLQPPVQEAFGIRNAF